MLTPDLGLVEDRLCNDTVLVGSQHQDRFTAVHRNLCDAEQAAAAECLEQQGVGSLAATIRCHEEGGVESDRFNFCRVDKLPDVDFASCDREQFGKFLALYEERFGAIQYRDRRAEDEA